MPIGFFIINRLSFLTLLLLLTILSSCSDNSSSHREQAIYDDASRKTVSNEEKKLAYIVSDTTIPFWKIMARGVSNAAGALGYELHTYSSNNDKRLELDLVKQAIEKKVAGIIISPTASHNCFKALELADKANIPVVISDIGTEGGEFISYISSNNTEGAYAIGKVLAENIHTHGWENAEVGIIAIPQDRLNGQDRTAGFLRAMKEADIENIYIKEQVTFSEEETYRFCKQLITMRPKLRALWLQGSDKYKGALRAITDTGKDTEVLLATFDAEPEFTDLISNGTILGSAMQQPYLMGRGAVYTMDRHLNGKRVDKTLRLPVLIASQENIDKKLHLIRKNVLGIDPKAN